jgi:hypothetical protein
MTVALCALAFAVSSCVDSPTATTPVKLGKTTIDEMMTNVAYKSWYEVGYSSYPDAAGQVTFDSSVAAIRASFDPNLHSVVMAIKPNCGCQTTQLWMPRVMKTLDAAGVPRENVHIYITDTRLAGIDDIKTKYSITHAPIFLVVKNETIGASINPETMPTNVKIEQQLASGFVKP